MNYSYWEIKSWLNNVDYTIVGSGIVGLNCALHLRQKHPKAKILILEKGILPQGASTKNAGFACFGSLSEILDDLKTHSEEEVLKLIKQRIKGLNVLRETLGDDTIAYKALGGYELFTSADEVLYKECLEKRDRINTLLKPLFNVSVFELKPNTFQFQNIQSQYIFNAFEGQIDTGKMMEALLCKVQSQSIKILNATTLESYTEVDNGVKLKTNHFECTTKRLLITNNGFASTLLNTDVKPARAQVLITKPIKDLHIKGTFHLDKGYYYFRNIDNRILLGGGRQLDFKTEETSEFGLTKCVQDELKRLLKETILPETNVEVDYRWSGIMGIGKQKKPIIKRMSNHVYCGVRLGGMGVAIGSLVGKALADIVE